MHGCLCGFILCLCCSVCRYRPCDGLIPLQGVLPTVYIIKKLKKRPRFNKRTVEPYIERWIIVGLGTMLPQKILRTLQFKQMCQHSTVSHGHSPRHSPGGMFKSR
jgi:hypothetical protein